MCTTLFRNKLELARKLHEIDHGITALPYTLTNTQTSEPCESWFYEITNNNQIAHIKPSTSKQDSHLRINDKPTTIEKKGVKVVRLMLSSRLSSHVSIACLTFTYKQWVSHFENHRCMKWNRNGWLNLVVYRVPQWVRFFWNGATRSCKNNNLPIVICLLMDYNMSQEGDTTCIRTWIDMCIVVPSKYKTIDS